jgi:hypothetical protein
VPLDCGRTGHVAAPAAALLRTAHAASELAPGINGNTAASIAMDGFALLFEHVPAGKDACHAFVVMIQKRLDEVDRQAGRLCNRRSRSAEIMGCEGLKLLVGHDTANCLAQRMTGPGPRDYPWPECDNADVAKMVPTLGVCTSGGLPNLGASRRPCSAES